MFAAGVVTGSGGIAASLLTVEEAEPAPGLVVFDVFDAATGAGRGGMSFWVDSMEDTTAASGMFEAEAVDEPPTFCDGELCSAAGILGRCTAGGRDEVASAVEF